MASGLIKALNIEREELSRVSILILQSVFLGIFAGAFDVGAHALFIETYGAALIPKAFAISGGVGIVITSVYSIMQKRIRFSVFAVLNLLFVAIMTIVLRFGFEIVNDKRLIFAIFVMMGPLTIISFLGFWGTVGRMFTLRQGKRLFGLIDTGQILGIILASYAIPLLLTFKFEVLNSLYICSGSIIIALLLQVFISSKYKLAKKEETTEKDVANKVKSSFWTLFSNRYTFLMVSFVVLSVLAAFFIHYSFLSVTEENYPDPNALASFIGMFMGTLMAFTLIFKTFIYGRLMKTYGLKVALLVSPVVLGLFTIGAAIIGSNSGYSAESASFTFFFLLIVSGKLFSKSFKDSIEVPSSKILYQTLDANIRFDVQARIDGTINEVAALFAGLLMAGMAMLSGIELIHFSYFLGGIIILWIISAFRLYRAYRKSLNVSLEKFQHTKVDERERNGLDIKKAVNLKYLLSLVPQTWNGYISANMKKLMASSEEVQKLTLDWVDKLNIVELQNQLISAEKKVSSNEKSDIRRLIDRFNIKKSDYSSDRIRKLAKSDKPDDKIKAITAILKSRDASSLELLLPLLREGNTYITIATIRAIGKLNLTDMAGNLLDFLSDKDYYSFAYHALKEMSEDVILKLDQGYNRTGITDKEKLRIIRLMMETGSADTSKYLLSKIEEPNQLILLEILKALNKLEFQLSEFYSNRLFQVLHRVIGITAWNLAAQYCVKENNIGNHLVELFDEELKRNYDLVFEILACVYEPQTIYHIRKNLESGTSEGIGFAIELLDIFVDETVKPYLFPLLEDTSVIEKINRLQTEYPLEILKPVDLLEAIMNRDYHQIHPVTRMHGIKAIETISDYTLNDTLIAQMFNPDIAIAEMAAIQAYRLDKEVFTRTSRRIGRERSEYLKEVAEKSSGDKIYGFFHKFSVVTSDPTFEGNGKQTLFMFSRHLKMMNLYKDDKISFSEIVPDSNFILYVSEGRMDIKYDGNKNLHLEKGEFLTLKESIDIYKDSIVPGENSSVMILPEDQLQELIFDYENEFLPFVELMNIKEFEKS